MSNPAPRATICLWYDHDAEDAANFYASIFPGSRIGAIQRAPADQAETDRYWEEAGRGRTHGGARGLGRPYHFTRTAHRPARGAAPVPRPLATPILTEPASLRQPAVLARRLRQFASLGRTTTV